MLVTWCVPQAQLDPLRFDLKTGRVVFKHRGDVALEWGKKHAEWMFERGRMLGFRLQRKPALHWYQRKTKTIDACNTQCAKFALCAVLNGGHAMLLRVSPQGSSPWRTREAARSSHTGCPPPPRSYTSHSDWDPCRISERTSDTAVSPSLIAQVQKRVQSWLLRRRVGDSQYCCPCLLCCLRLSLCR